MDRRTVLEILRLQRLEKRALEHRERGRLSGNQALMRQALRLELAVHERLNALNRTVVCKADSTPLAAYRPKLSI